MVFIVAELGVNWRDLAEAGDMIIKAAEAGASAVKFQCYKPEHVKGHPREEELVSKILTRHDLELLKNVADENNVEFMATPYFEEAVDWLDLLVKRWKIRYADRENWELIGKIMDLDRKREIYISNDLDIKSSKRIRVVYCIPKYPPKLSEIKLKKANFGDLNFLGGYSNHYPSISMPLLAVARGARYVEVHVKLDEYSGRYVPIDDLVSITFSQLAELCRLVREIEKTGW